MEYDWKEEAESAVDYGMTSGESQRGNLIQIVQNWMQCAAQNQRNADYYRGLVEVIGETIGERAYKADDGVIHQDVLCAKVPEIVAGDYHKHGI